MNDQDRLVFQTSDSAGEARVAPASEAGGRASELPVFGERQLCEFESSPRAMRIFDRASLRYLAVNDAALRLYGYSRAELLSLTVKDTRHPDEHDVMLANIAEPAGLLMNFGPHRHLRKSGEIVMVEVIAQDVLFNGRPARVSVTIDVTERMRMMDLARQREQEFETLADNLPDLVARYSLSRRFLYVNRAIETLFSMKRDAILGRTQREIGLPESLIARYDASIAEALVSGQPHTLEFSLQTPAGGERLFEAYHVPERDAAGDIASVLCVARDITERKRRESAVRESNEFLRGMLESSRDCIKVLDLEGRLVWMSTWGQRLMEIDDVASVMGRPYLDFWSGPQRESARAALASACSGGVSRFGGYCPSAKGTPMWWDGIAAPILSGDGKPEKLLVVSRDVTESERAGHALRESEDRFRQLAENIREVFWINTPAGDDLVYVSPAYEEIWGRSRESLYRDPRTWMEPIHPEDLPLVQSNPEKMARGEHTDIEYRLVRPDGSLRWIRDRSYPMKRGDGTPLVCGIAEDITEQKRAQQERLAHAIHQRDALVRELHHRIKNHLQGIAGLLRDKAADDPAATDTIEAAVAQLLSVAVVYGLQSEVAESGVSLSRVLEAICSSAEGLSGAKVSFTCVADTGGIELAATEAVPIAVALNELVFNAVEHGVRRGGIRRIEVALSENKDGADIRIVNRGKLSARFDYARGIGTGTGLDLVKTLLGPSGGSLRFGSHHGRVEVNLNLRPPLVAARKGQPPMAESSSER